MCEEYQQVKLGLWEKIRDAVLMIEAFLVYCSLKWARRAERGGYYWVEPVELWKNKWRLTRVARWAGADIIKADPDLHQAEDFHKWSSRPRVLPCVSDAAVGKNICRCFHQARLLLGSKVAVGWFTDET